MQGVRVEAARERASGWGRHQVVGAREAGYRIEEDHHVTTVLDDAPGALVDELGDPYVVGGGLIERAGHHLYALHRLPEVGYLLRPLVDQKPDHAKVGFVQGYRGRDLLEQRRHARLRG